MSPRSDEFIERAYYSMPNAARAALSERDEHARTHRGTWKAVKPSREEAERYVSGAGNFIAALERMLDADT